MRFVQPFIILSLIMKFIYSSEHLSIHLYLLSTNTYWVSQCASCSVLITAAASAKSLQSYPTLCDPTGSSPPGSPVLDSPGKSTGVGCHFLLQCMGVKSESEVAQSCPTPSDPMDCSLPGSSVHGIFQARVLEWGAIAFSSAYYLRYLKYK